MFAIGLAVWGYSSFPRPSSWIPLAAGLLLLGFVRPHVAGVVVAAMVIGFLLGRTRSTAAGWFFQALIWAVGLAITFYLSSGALGLDSPQAAVEYVEQQAERTNVGGSAGGVVSMNPLRIPEAFVSTLFRPFVWEARSPFMVISSLEGLVLFGLIVWRRRQIWSSLRNARRNRLVGFSITFLILYATMLGFAIANLGIIARQRVLVLPMLLLLMQGTGDEGSVKAIDGS